jgi:hypothetical protein
MVEVSLRVIDLSGALSPATPIRNGRNSPAISPNMLIA